MPTQFAATIRTLLAIGAFCPALAGARSTEVNVVVDFTPEGRKVAHPSPGNPAYYFPVLGSFEELGAGTAGERPPVKWSVAHVVALELARQGYLEMKPAPYVNQAGQVTYRDGTVVTVPAHPVRGSRIELNAPGGIALTRAPARGARRSLLAKGGAFRPSHGPRGGVLPGDRGAVRDRSRPRPRHERDAQPDPFPFSTATRTRRSSASTPRAATPSITCSSTRGRCSGWLPAKRSGTWDSDFDRQAIMQRIEQGPLFCDGQRV